jgi:uncharacterized membrane protein YfcA
MVDLPTNHTFAAITATLLTAAGVVGFVIGWHHSIHGRTTEAVTYAAGSTPAWLLAGSVLLFVNPPIALFMVVVFALAFRYAVVLEDIDVHAARPGQARPKPNRPEPADDSLFLADLDRAFRWTAPPSIFKYPAPYTERRHGLHTYRPGCCSDPEPDREDT